MALDFPWSQYIQGKREQGQNRRQSLQNLGPSMNSAIEGFNTIGQAIQEKRQKDQWQKTINQLMNDPTLNPQLKAMLPTISQRPELFGQLGPELLKLGQPQKQPTVWHPVSGMMSKAGKPLEINEATGEYREAPIQAKATSFGSTMGPIRQAQYTIQDLPSNQPPSTAGGAAYQVKVGARQGKALIAKPGSQFRTSLASGDIARSINRVAPTDEAMKNAGFSDTLINRWTKLKTQVTANPMMLENPKMRKEMYDILDDMDKSATPFIKIQLDNMDDAGLSITPNTRKRELGETLPEIAFVADDQGTGTKPYSDAGKEARYQAWKKANGL